MAGTAEKSAVLFFAHKGSCGAGVIATTRYRSARVFGLSGSSLVGAGETPALRGMPN